MVMTALTFGMVRKMRARTMRKIASWNSQLSFPKENKSFKTYRFFEGIGWVVIDEGQRK